MNSFLVVDYRLNEKIKEYFLKLGYILIPTLKNSIVYEEISGHPDIFLTRIKGKYIAQPTLYEYLIEELKLYGKTNVENILIKGKNLLMDKYPKNIGYNVCNIGEFVFHNFKYTDEIVLSETNDFNLKKINVNQGYTNCSITKIGELNAVTSDYQIHKKLTENNIDNVLLENCSKYIKLLKGEGYSNNNGFIGGASVFIQSKFVIFGDLKNMEETDKNKLVDFLNKKDIEIVDFKGLDIVDYGSIIEIKI